ncbi:DUF1642 domain-containing protein [Streptococcus uberis]|uniref:DUF1642 domain-containing protein n=1 Tax=Streptococcus uberis TaxID=1349 RepID=UPI0020BDE1D6|nr:DUF1642 domain-containing protein [Streptococcus uberis]
MNIEKIKSGKPIWVRGYADGVGNIDFLDRERNVDELECLIKDDIFYMSESDFRLDEPVQPKPEIPQLVAEWIEKYKEKRCRLYHALEHVFDDVELGLYIKQQEGDYTEIIARAWLYGYTVKKEQLYTVEIPDPNSKDTVYYLFKNEDGQVEIGSVLFLETEPDDSWRDDPDMQLTEQEIKKDFEWALKWKKEVI